MENYLVHFGILGQKWGVRRFQNPDGTLTAEGKRHYDTYKEGARKTEKVYKEIDELKNKHYKKFKEAFGDDVDNGSYKNDIDAIDMFLQDYGIKGEKFYKARAEQYKYINTNKESINAGKNIAEKLLKERRWDYDR